MAIATSFGAHVALAGSGFGSGMNLGVGPVAVPTFYANSAAGPSPALVAGARNIDPVTGLPVMINSGKALRKFVDTLPGIPGLTSFGANNLGQYIPLAKPEKWVDLNGNPTLDDYYEIAAVEFTEKMHSDLAKPTRLRGYVQLSTATNPGKHIALKYPNGTAITNAAGQPVYAYDAPHHLGPFIQSAKGTAVRVKFINYLPTGAGGALFIPVDTTLTGAGMGPDGVTPYTENRAGIHLVGGQSPWISAGTPHQWVAPAGEATAYAAGLGKGASSQNVPDMAEPEAGASTLYFPNDMSARFMFMQDRTSGLTRLNSYAGLEAGYMITDPVENAMVNGATVTVNGVTKTFTAGTIPADQIPLIIEDKTFVPSDIAQQDSLWDPVNWGQPGDLWFPHVYEKNQDPASANGANPVGRWDFGPLFWPIFPAKDALPTGAHGDASFVPEAFMDTPLINGTAYPTLTVDPKAYRMRILNASNDRYVNLALYKADTSVKAPQLDLNGNPIVDDLGVPQVMLNTEVKMVPAVGDAAGNPVGWNAMHVNADGSTGAQLPLPQYPGLATNILSEPSGPTRAWPVDNRPGGAPDPATAGPDFISIGNDGGLLPHAVDVPAQPVTYEANRRSITVGNIYGYGMLLGPAERADTIVDFSAYAGQTLILYNDAPAPVPFNDVRNDYYTGGPDQTGAGGAYATKPGYGPNTRTMMQIKVNAVPPATPFSADVLAAALPVAYGLSQPAPLVPATAYNAAFGTNDTDIYGHVATGSAAQPTLDFATSVNGGVTLTGITLVTSGGTVGNGGVVAPNGVPGSGSGYDAANPPTVVFNNVVNGVNCLGVGGVSASAAAVVSAITHQVTEISGFLPGNGYTCAPTVTFQNPPGTSGIGAQVTVSATNMFHLPVLTKAEQELFDNRGRYNSTGGAELPLTNGVIQTTVPLNYIDSATEFLKDGEVQIWKLVDNGLWTNSMHFNMVDVQLINRVGWDGTVKVPASNELGWRDTLRLNPLEDVLVAVRAKRASVPFGMPKSSRLMDPSKPAGTTGAAASGLGFTTATGVLPLPSVTNDLANYDNEFTWGSSILGHAENDLTRPVVFIPNVEKPDAPLNLVDVGGFGNLSWTDTTPAATSIANVKNELGFKVLKAPIDLNGLPFGAFVEIAKVKANQTHWTDPNPAPRAAYQVVAYNVAGDSPASNSYVEQMPLAPTTFTAGPLAYNSVTLNWSGNSTTNSLQVWRDGKLLTTLPGTATSYVDTTVTAVMSYSYTIVATNAFGNASTAALVVNTPMIPVATPTGLTATLGAYSAATKTVPVTVRWTDAANNDTAYWVEVSADNGLTFPSKTVIPTATAAQTTSVTRAMTLTPNVVATPGSIYVFKVTAVNVTGNATSTSTPASVSQDLSTPVTPVAPLVVAGTQTATRAPISWAAVAVPVTTPATTVSYVVQVQTNGSGTYVPLASQTALTASPTIAAGNTYSIQVLAQATRLGLTSPSALSNTLTVTTPPAATTRPTVVAGAVGSKQITVTWTNPSSNIASWVVQRTSTVAGSTAVTLTPTIGVAGTTYSFVDTAPAGRYTYRVQAANAAGATSAMTAASAAVTAP
jgi:FtsP/CotA-like multicopper oxidase with cupredoxin domain